MSTGNKSRWTKSEKIAILALIVSLASALFTGLTYLSNEASKRAELSVLITKTNFSLTSQNDPDLPVLAIFSVGGVITNEGPRLCQVKNLTLVITLQISDKLREYYNASFGATYIDFSNSYIYGTVNNLGWNDTYFNSKSEREFDVSIHPKLDSSYSNLSISQIAECYIKIIYDDGISIQIKQQPLTDWIRTS
jgi:hypothetical protein